MLLVGVDSPLGLKKPLVCQINSYLTRINRVECLIALQKSSQKKMGMLLFQVSV